jgi:hypothetical protein
MTLETCKKRLELAEKAGNEEEINFWKARIERKLRHPKYANLQQEGDKDGKKSKR